MTIEESAVTSFVRRFLELGSDAELTSHKIRQHLSSFYELEEFFMEVEEEFDILIDSPRLTESLLDRPLAYLVQCVLHNSTPNA